MKINSSGRPENFPKAKKKIPIIIYPTTNVASFVTRGTCSILPDA
jgi:hypothetical protein